MKRDTYNDYVTSLEAYSSGRHAERYVDAVCDYMLHNSGAYNVRNARVEREYLFHADAVLLRVVFDSKAWTGL